MDAGRGCDQRLATIRNANLRITDDYSYRIGDGGGTARTIMSVLPDPTLILLAAASHGLLNGFGESGGKFLAAMAVLAIVSGAAML